MNFAKRSIRILVVSNCPIVEHQGSGYVVSGFVNGLRQRGHLIEAYGPDRYEAFPWAKSRAKTYRQSIGMVPFVLKQLFKTRFDLVVFYGGEAWLITWIIKSLWLRTIPILAHSNGLETHGEDIFEKHQDLLLEEKKWYHIRKSPLYSLAFRLADALVTVSSFEAKHAVEKKLKSASDITVLNNPLPSSFLGQVFELERSKTIGFVGSWIPRKGIALIRQAIPAVLRRHPTAKFVMVGVGVDLELNDVFPKDVQHQIQVMPTVTDKEDLKEIYQRMSILIVPSIYESFGLVIAEAMSCGCAVVANSTGFAAGLSSSEAVVLKDLTSSALEGAVEALLSDDTLRQKIASGGYERVQTLRWEDALEAMDGKVHELVFTPGS